MNVRGQYSKLDGQPRTHVGATLVHTLELKQRYDNAKTAAVQALLNDLARDGVASAVGTNRWEIALPDGAWVRLTWYPDYAALEVTITDRELRPVDQVAPARRRYEAILRKITPQLRTYGATTVGAVVYAGQAVTGPHLWARSRAIQAVNALRLRAHAPYYVYAEVDGTAAIHAARVLDEANAIYFALDRSPGEVYASIFDVTDASWPGPAADVYRAVPQRRPADHTYVGQGSIFGHTPTDVENELDQLHGELMCFGQEVIELTRPLKEQATVTAQQERDEELPAWKVVESFQPLVDEVYRIEKLLNEAGLPAKITAEWRAQHPPYDNIRFMPIAPFAASKGVPPKKAEDLKTQFIAAKEALDKFMSTAQRREAIKRARELSTQRSELEGKALGEAPLVQWSRSVWTPFFDGWRKFREEKKDIPLQTWPLSGTWDRIQDYRRQWVNLRKNAPFKSRCPDPLDPDRKDPSITGIFGDVGKILKWGVIGALGIGAVVALSSVASNLRRGKDPGEKYVELIRERRSVPARRAPLALPSGEGA